MHTGLEGSIWWFWVSYVIVHTSWLKVVSMLRSFFLKSPLKYFLMFASHSLSDCRNISKRVNMKRNKWILTLIPCVWCLVIVTLPSACFCIVDRMEVVSLSSLLGKFCFFQYMCVWKSLWHIVFWIVFRSTLGSYGKMQQFTLISPPCIVQDTSLQEGESPGGSMGMNPDASASYTVCGQCQVWCGCASQQIVWHG